MLKRTMEYICQLAGRKRSKRRAQSILETKPAQIVATHYHPTNETVQMGDSVRPVFLYNGWRKHRLVLTERGCFVPSPVSQAWKR
jgi:hypothetical protein